MLPIATIRLLPSDGSGLGKEIDLVETGCLFEKVTQALSIAFRVLHRLQSTDTF